MEEISMGHIDQTGEIVETDVLIIGGGLAGNNAAIAALEKGVKVLIVDKSSIERCGAIAGGFGPEMLCL